MAKGSNCEREVSELLSVWWSDGSNPEVFYRTGGSGSRLTSRRKQNKETTVQGGDIASTDSYGEPLTKAFCFEVKTGYGRKDKGEIIRWDLLDYLDSRQKEPKFTSFWKQCLRDATANKKIPILIFRRNLRSLCICISKPTYLELCSFYSPFVGTKLELSVLDINVVILSLQDFFEWINDIRGFVCSKQSVLPISKAIKKHS